MLFLCSRLDGANIARGADDDDSPLYSYNFNVMPPDAAAHRCANDDTIAEIQAAIAQLNSTMATAPSVDDVTSVQQALAALNDTMTTLQEHTDAVRSRVDLAHLDDDQTLTYERWGRTTCPADTGATLVYAGQCYVATS